jgi:hypothetical protein
MMRLLDIALLLPMTVAFALSGWEVSQKTAATAIHLQAECSRRYALFTTASAVIAPFEATTHPAKVGANFCDDTIEFVEEPQQMATDGKVDLNAALVVCLLDSCLWRKIMPKSIHFHTMGIPYTG